MTIINFSKIFIILFFLFFSSCKTDNNDNQNQNQNKKYNSEFGSIDVLTNVYFTASENLDNYKSFHLSNMNYVGKEIIEIIPNIVDNNIMENVVYINDSVFYEITPVENANSIVFDLQKTELKPKSVYSKKKGAVWLDIPVHNFEQRIDLKDTVLYNKKTYSRFKIKTGLEFTVFYVFKTDEILPYSLSKEVDSVYGGRVERIDSYNKGKDVFTTVLLIHKTKLNKKAIDIFSFNEDLEKIN